MIKTKGFKSLFELKLLDIMTVISGHNSFLIKCDKRYLFKSIFLGEKYRGKKIFDVKLSQRIKNTDINDSLFLFPSFFYDSYMTLFTLNYSFFFSQILLVNKHQRTKCNF